MSGVESPEVAVATPDTYRIEPEDFVAIWQRSGSAGEAARRLGRIAKQDIPEHVVSSLATDYRSKGVQLKRMRTACFPAA